LALQVPLLLLFSDRHKATLHNFSVEGCVLRLHIGIGTGRLGFVHVGGVKDRMEFLITGEPLEQVLVN
jgi:hypothetical protein